MSKKGKIEVLHDFEYIEKTKFVERINLIREIIKSAPGQISEKDGLFLYELASRCTDGVIVEIGAGTGTSTVCLAKGSKSGHNVKVYSIDPHISAADTPDPEAGSSENDGIPDLKYYIDQGKVFPHFKETLRRMQVDDIVIPIVDYSELAYNKGLNGYEWNLPIEFLFIDGDHRYNYVKKDLELWGKWVIDGGIIAMHDKPFTGVQKAIDNMVINNPRYSEIRNIDKSPIFNMVVAEDNHDDRIALNRLKLTITISNWNRDWFLDRSIYLISKQTLSQDDWELIVVDDGSTDKTEQVINRYKDMNIIKNFHYIKKIKKREKYGNCAIARNIGAKYGIGDYILFTDPEVMSMPDWAEQHYLAHKGRHNTSVIGYCLNPREYHIVTEKCRGPFLGNVYMDYDWYNILETWRIMEEEINRLKITHGVTDEDIKKEFFMYLQTQGGHSIARELFYKLRGFEEDYANKDLGLDKWAGEDTWLSSCLSRTDCVRIYSEKAKTIHIYHDKNTSNCDAVTYCGKYEKEHPDQCQSNLNREWGLIEENGFEVVF